MVRTGYAGKEWFSRIGAERYGRHGLERKGKLRIGPEFTVTLDWNGEATPGLDRLGEAESGWYS